MGITSLGWPYLAQKSINDRNGNSFISSDTISSRNSGNNKVEITPTKIVPWNEVIDSLVPGIISLSRYTEDRVPTPGDHCLPGGQNSA